MSAHERRIQFAHQTTRNFAVGADHHAIGTHEIVYRRAFFQKFRIANHVESHFDTAFFQLFLNCRLNLVRGAHGHGRFIHHHHIVIDALADFTRHGQHILQIG